MLLMLETLLTVAMSNTQSTGVTFAKGAITGAFAYAARPQGTNRLEAIIRFLRIYLRS